MLLFPLSLLWQRSCVKFWGTLPFYVEERSLAFVLFKIILLNEGVQTITVAVSKRERGRAVFRRSANQNDP
jgi:hypothetical protein